MDTSLCAQHSPTAEILSRAWQVSGKEAKGELRCPVISPVATRGHDHCSLSSSAQGRQRMHCGLSQTEVAALVQ